jgi:hypothetical protein
MKHRPVMSLVCFGSTIVLFAMTSCAQLPHSAAVVSAMRCPAYPDTQFLDPEKFDLGTLTDGRCNSFGMSASINPNASTLRDGPARNQPSPAFTDSPREFARVHA